MKRALLLSALVAGTLAAGVAYADDRCNAPMAEWQPREALQQKLAAEGWQVSRIKTDDGCHEVRAIDARGQRVEAKFDPKTLEMVGFERKH